MRTPLPFEPEPFLQLRARFHAAYEPIWPYAPPDYEGDVPALHREHVFDFEDGVRLVVQRVQSPRRAEVGVLVAGCVEMGRGPTRRPEDLMDRYFELAGQPIGGEILDWGVGGDGRIVWWVVKDNGQVAGQVQQ